MPELVLGADGGNSKTDMVIATVEGEVLARERGPGTRPHVDGMAATARGLADLLARTRDAAGVPASARIAVGAFHLANVDLPDAEREAECELAALGLVDRVVVRNDTFAVLLAGEPSGHGVAVVSGAGINALGVHPDGTVARFLALGETTGDWGGGYAVGLAGLGAAVRAADGRGRPTALRDAVARHFGAADAGEVAIALTGGTLAMTRLHELAPLVVELAEAGDQVAMGIVGRLAEEVAGMACALLERLGLLDSPTPVVLGGGTLQTRPGLLLERITAGVVARAPLARTRVLDVPPVTGAVLDALDACGVGEAARARARRAFQKVSA